MKKKRKKKLTSIPRLIKLAHAAWSRYVRTRDGKCLMCGTTDSLEAHHGVVPQKRGNSTRFLPDNGFALCWYEHRIVYHKGLAKKDWLDRWQTIVDRMVSKERQEQIIRISHEVKKYDRQELENVVTYYDGLTEELELRKEESNLDLIQP